ncbi:MAG: glycosyltransferase family 2 protein [Bacteroidota bacterium]
MSKQFSIIILTFNEETHLPRLLESTKGLEYDLFILDSGSTDKTLKIAEEYQATVAYNKFENHPKQWDFALNHFEVQTPWIIGLDADHIFEPALYHKLKDFHNDQIPKDVNGIYFNRKNYFKGRWIKHGGYFPKYLLKMFRTGIGHSDLNENMDHRFIVAEKTITWKDGYLKEENLKENEISFWINKHNRYSQLVAEEELERQQQDRIQSVQPKFFGSPDQRIAYYKRIWWKLPLYWRPIFYFLYRFIWKRGFMDGPEGRLFHFLQGFWFRLIVDEKIRELKKEKSVS